jgi:tellurite resistance protein TehA-like permease
MAMTDLTGTPSSSTMLRWTTLIVIAANVAFIADYDILSRSRTIAELVAGYGDALVPAGYAKGIGVAVLFAFLLFYIAALLPSRRRRRTYDKLVIPLVPTSVLASCWIVAFRHEKIDLSVALLAAIVALACIMFARVASVAPGKYSLWLRVPFSLHFAAMTIALLVALTQWSNAAITPEMAAAPLLALATLAGGFVAFRYRDFVYPAVVASAAGAMFVAQRVVRPDVAAAALMVGAGMFAVAVLAAVAMARQPRCEPKVRPSRSGPTVARSTPEENWYPIEGNTSVIRL